MRRRLVLDASVAVAWCFEDEKTRYTEQILDIVAADGEALIPAGEHRAQSPHYPGADPA